MDNAIYEFSLAEPSWYMSHYTSLHMQYMLSASAIVSSSSVPLLCMEQRAGKIISSNARVF